MQYDKAKELMDSTSLHRKVSGPINYIHQYIDFSNQPIYNGKGQAYARTCPPAMGYSFAAGTTDGPGAFDFKQGATSSTPFWNLVRDFIRRPSPQLIQCQHPKPILLASGEMRFPYAWQPSVIPLQLISIGHVSPSPNETSLLLTALPAEFTTMAGRRVRNLLQSMLDSSSEETGVPSSYQSNILTTSRQIKNKHIQTAALKRSDAVDGKWKPIAMPARSVRSRRWDNQPVLRLSDRESIEPTNDVSNDVSEPPSNDLGVSSTLSSAAKPIVPAITIINADSDALISSPLKTGSSHKVILAGLANAYSSYVTTYEEYQRQRYEAASTLYGPYTLHAYLQNFRLLASWLQKLRTGQQLPQSRSDKATVQPPNLLNKQLQLKPGVVYDGTKIGTKFGDVVKDARPLYRTGDQVQVTYRSGHPQNWPAIENTYLTVEYLDASKQRWVVIATDANWETKYANFDIVFLHHHSRSIFINLIFFSFEVHLDSKQFCDGRIDQHRNLGYSVQCESRNISYTSLWSKQKHLSKDHLVRRNIIQFSSESIK